MVAPCCVRNHDYGIVLAMSKSKNPVEAIRSRVKPIAARRQLKRLSEASGVSYAWVQSFANGGFPNAGALTLQKVELALPEFERETA